MKLENQTLVNVLVQIELTGLIETISPAGQLVIDTDFDKGEEIHLEFQSDRIVVWGGVAAGVVETKL